MAKPKLNLMNIKNKQKLKLTNYKNISTIGISDFKNRIDQASNEEQINNILNEAKALNTYKNEN